MGSHAPPHSSQQPATPTVKGFLKDTKNKDVGSHFKVWGQTWGRIISDISNSRLFKGLFNKLWWGHKWNRRNMTEEKDRRIKVALRLEQAKIKEIDQACKIADSISRNAFIEEAIDFYCGYLIASKNKYIPIALSNCIEAIMKGSEDRIAKLLFKNTVELAMTMNVVAHNFDIDSDTLNRLRKQCVAEVKSSIGKINFEEINRYQKSD